MIADAIYAAAERSHAERLASDLDIDRAERVIRRFLEELPGEMSVAEIRAELAAVREGN